MDATKATGLDCIGPRLLKIALAVLTPSITYIINKSIEFGFFHVHGKMQILTQSLKLGARIA